MYEIKKILLVGFLLTFSVSSGIAIEIDGFVSKSFVGNNGRIIRVTNLNPIGEGSLSSAITTKGPRLIVFEVGGVIDLDMAEVVVKEPYLIIAGQTAPSPGITLIRGGLKIETHDVFIEHIRVRPGDAGQERFSGWEPDGITTAGKNAYNIKIDHCSFSWAIDENLSVSGPGTLGEKETSRRVTLSNCIIAEGLSNSSHSKGEHSKGSLVHDFCTNIVVIGNLYANNMKRNPFFKANTTGAIVNNLIYNPGKSAIQLNYVLSEWKDSKYIPKPAKVSLVGNVIIKGIDTIEDIQMIESKGHVYLNDNIAYDLNWNRVPVTMSGVDVLKEREVWPENLVALKSEKVIAHVILNAGARPADRDIVDRRIISDLLKKKGRIIDSQKDVGGYPVVSKTYRKLKVPKHNIENWLKLYSEEVEFKSNY